MPGDARSSAARCRVAFVDDDVAILQTFARIAARHGYEASVFASSIEFLAAVEDEIPDVLVLDLRMPEMDGIHLQRALVARAIDIPTIFVSAHPNLASSVEALRGGAIDFLEKPCDERQLATALKRAVELGAETRSRRHVVHETATRARSLTPRERQVFELVASGRLNKQIASVLGTSEKTIKVHRARVMAKMHADSVADLVRMFDALEAASKHADGAPRDSQTDRAQRDGSAVRPHPGKPQGEDRSPAGPA